MLCSQSLPLVPINSQTNQVHNVPIPLFNTHIKGALSSMFRRLWGFFPLNFMTKAVISKPVYVHLQQIFLV